MLIDNFMLNVKGLIEDPKNVLSENDYENFIYEALGVYGRARPLRVTTWVSCGEYEFDMPSRYDLSFSTIESVGFQVGENLVYLEKHDWMVYRNCAGVKFRLLRHTMLSSEVVRLVYSAPYDKPQLRLVPASDLEAFFGLAGSLCCAALGRYYSLAATDLSAGKNQEKAAVYSSRAKELMDVYNLHMGKEQ